MILITSVAVPESVNVSSPFLLAVSVMDGPGEYVIYCGTFYSGMLPL